MAVSIDAGKVWGGVKAVTGVAYKAAFLYLAYEYVLASLQFYAFSEGALRAFYRLFTPT